jgi:hypothetical protein
MAHDDELADTVSKESVQPKEDNCGTWYYPSGVSISSCRRAASIRGKTRYPARVNQPDTSIPISPHLLHRVLHRSNRTKFSTCTQRWISKFGASGFFRPDELVCVYFPASSDVKTAGEIGERSQVSSPASSTRKTLRSNRVRAGRKSAASDVRRPCGRAEACSSRCPWPPETPWPVTGPRGNPG